GKLLDEPRAGAGFTGDVRDIEFRMRRAQPQQFPAAVAADADDADAKTHELLESTHAGEMQGAGCLRRVSRVFNPCRTVGSRHGLKTRDTKRALLTDSWNSGFGWIRRDRPDRQPLGGLAAEVALTDEAPFHVGHVTGAIE